MIACLAIKDSYCYEIGDSCVKIILMMDRASSAEERQITNTALQILKNILITATRSRSEELFYALKMINKSYQEREFMPDSALLSEFYLTVLFAAADHRWSKG